MKKIDSHQTGMYSLKKEEFAIEIDHSRIDVRSLIPPQSRKFKEENTVWYLFTKGSVEFEEQRTQEIGILSITFTFKIKIIENPILIKLNDVSLTSLENFKHYINENVLPEFIKNLLNNTDYRELEKIFKEYSGEPTYTTESFIQQKLKFKGFQINFHTTKTNLQQSGILHRTINGNLFEIAFLIENIELTGPLKTLLSDDDKDIGKNIDDQKLYFKTLFDQSIEMHKIMATVIENAPPGSELQLKGFIHLVDKIDHVIDEIKQIPGGLLPANKKPVVLELDANIVEDKYPFNIHKIIQKNETLLDNYEDKMDGIKLLILPKLKLYQPLNDTDKNNLFERWYLQRKDKLKDNTIESLVNHFLSENQLNCSDVL
jgi:hypothetical protein